MIGFIRFVIREYKKSIRIKKAQKRCSEIMNMVVNGTTNKNLVSEWARLQFIIKYDQYGDMQRHLDKLNKRNKK